MSNVQMIPLLYPGLVVRSPRSGEVFKITNSPARNAKSVHAINEQNRAYKLSIFGLEVVDPSEFKLQGEDITSKLFLGTKVRVKDAKYPGVYVVIKKLPTGGFHVAKLGGDGDRYLRPQAAQLELVED